MSSAVLELLSVGHFLPSSPSCPPSNVANQIVTQTQRQKMLVARNRAILLLFLESDIRLEKLTRLRLEDIELQRQRVTVRLGKMRKPRPSSFGPQTKKTLWKYLSPRPHDADHDALWITEEGTFLSIGGVHITIRRLQNDPAPLTILIVTLL